MATETVSFRRITSTYGVTVDGHDYRVTCDRWGGTPWNPEKCERWTVIVSNNDRCCDPDKPTFKRVVTAVKAALQERNN
jgi:hypothetical protein